MSEPWSQLSSEEKFAFAGRFWRYLSPTLFIGLSLGLMLLPVWIPVPIIPQLGLLGVLYWTTYSFNLMPPGAAFAVGLLQDLWLGQPLGLNASLLALFAWVLSGQFNVYASRPFRFGWLFAVPVIVLYETLTWGITRLLGQTCDLHQMLWQTGSTLIAYPAAVWVHAKIQRLVTDPLLYL